MYLIVFENVVCACVHTNLCACSYVCVFLCGVYHSVQCVHVCMHVLFIAVFVFECTYVQVIQVHPPFTH